MTNEHNHEHVAEIERLERLLAEAKKRIGMPTNNASIRIDAGSIGVWLVSCMCAFMFGLNLLLFFVIIGHSRQIDDMSHYLQAIYQEAPHLKPKEIP